ncbi:MAG: 3-hydroxyacyl-ACP dehydratase FabZ [Alphaproteobacteria bacterium]|nr:3-hydroxyacyl-ACP dehydratase FabZ [Alphaproteobacteria bacterium]
MLLMEAHVESKTILYSEILTLLPHRYPFLLVDKIIDVVEFKSAKGIKNVTFNEPHFVGHFPDDPIMPGVLIVEAMAQTAAALVLKSLNMKADEDKKAVYFMSISEAKFRKPVRPGDTMIIETINLQHRRSVWKFKGIARVDGVDVAEAEFTAMIADKSPTPQE